jgi:apolipoprotein N-acyltransferase
MDADGQGLRRYFIPAFLELVALVCLFEAGDSVRAHEYRPAMKWFVWGLLFAVVGFIWPLIRQKFFLTTSYTLLPTPRLCYAGIHHRELVVGSSTSATVIEIRNTRKNKDIGSAQGWSGPQF